MVSVLGEMKGAAMKIGQMASFIDIDFLPPEYREIYQEQLAKLRAQAPAMPWEKVREVLVEEYDGKSPEQVFASIEEDAFAAASIGQVHRATLHDGSAVAVKVQYPGVAEALESDMANAGIIVRVAKALAPGLDAKAVAGELRERVLEELDYEYEAQNQRAFARAYDGHPFIYVPKVHSRLSRRRVLVSEYVDGRDFEEVKRLPQDERDIFGEIVFRFCFGSIYHLQHFNADTHPGNYLLMDDGRVAFLDFGMTKRLQPEQIMLEQRAVDAASRDDPGALREALDEIGFLRDADAIDAQRLMEHVKFVGGWYLEDEQLEITPKRVMKMIEVTSDPRSDFYDLVRKEAIPADELMGRRMETGPAGRPRPAAGEGQLAPDHARVGLRGPALDGAGRGGVALLRTAGNLANPGLQRPPAGSYRSGGAAAASRRSCTRQWRASSAGLRSRRPSSGPWPPACRP